MMMFMFLFLRHETTERVDAEVRITGEENLLISSLEYTISDSRLSPLV